MQKGAKVGQQKKSKPRKHIQIKQSSRVSPIKEVLQPEETKFLERTSKHGKIEVPALKKFQFNFSNEEMQQFSTRADGLISVQLMSKILKKQQQSLHEFYAACPPIVQKSFKRILQKIQASFATIRQQRIEQLKQQTVMFVPPDQDNFQKHKGKVLNNWIKQYIEVHQQKQNFQTASQKYLPIFKETEQKINKLASVAPVEKVQPILQKMAESVNQRNKIEVINKKDQIKSDLIAVVQTADQMRKVREETIKQRQKQAKQRQLQVQINMLRRTPSFRMALFSVEDYFF